MSNIYQTKLEIVILKMFTDNLSCFNVSVSSIEIKAIISNVDHEISNRCSDDLHYTHESIVKQAVGRLIFSGELKMKVERTGAVMLIYEKDRSKSQSISDNLYEQAHIAARVENLEDELQRLKNRIDNLVH